MKRNAIQKGVDFIGRQQEPFKVNLVRATSQSFLTHLVRQYQPIYILRLGATNFQLGLINSIGGIAGTVIAPPTGWLADKYGIRKVFLVATPLMVLGSLLFTVAWTWMATIPALLLTLLAEQLLMIACPMVCGSYLKSEERATGKQFCDAISTVPGLFAPMIAAIVIARFGGLTAEGIRPLYYICAVGFSLSLVWVYARYSDILKNDAQLALPRFAEDMKEVFERGNAVRSWLACLLLSSTSMYIGLVYLPIYVAEVKHGNEFVVGSVATASLILPVFLAMAVGRFADTFGRKKSLYVTISLYCLSILLLIGAQNTPMLLVSGVLQGFYTLSAVTQGAISAELVHVSLLGRWYGIINVFTGMARIAGPIFGAVIWSVFGPNYVFFSIILLEVSNMAILWLKIPETLRPVQPVQSSLLR